MKIKGLWYSIIDYLEKKHSHFRTVVEPERLGPIATLEARLLGCDLTSFFI